MGKEEESVFIPSLEEIEAERSRLKQNKREKRSGRSGGRGVGRVLILLVLAAAIAFLLSYLWFPVVRIYGTSMEPNLTEGDIVLCLKSDKIRSGDVVSFYHGNKLLLKRAVGLSRDWVEIDAEGNVHINGSKLSEPYLLNKSFGDSDLKYPYQVPDGRIFVLGDNREISVDSRNSEIGCVGADQLCGKVLFRIWPLERFGTLD